MRLAPADVALFRFLLEAYENLAFFTVLERKAALLKVVFSPQREDAVRAALDEIGRTVPLTAEDWPLARPEEGKEDERKVSQPAGRIVPSDEDNH